MLFIAEHSQITLHSLIENGGHGPKFYLKHSKWLTWIVVSTLFECLLCSKHYDMCCKYEAPLDECNIDEEIKHLNIICFVIL
jgi:hypothetical protein